MCFVHIARLVFFNIMCGNNDFFFLVIEMEEATGPAENRVRITKVKMGKLCLQFFFYYLFAYVGININLFQTG